MFLALQRQKAEWPPPAARVPGPSPRGTGCALATAIAVELARGQGLTEAVGTAKEWLGAMIEGAAMVGGERRLS